jgi:hypothetical protein
MLARRSTAEATASEYWRNCAVEKSRVPRGPEERLLATSTGVLPLLSMKTLTPIETT